MMRFISLHAILTIAANYEIQQMDVQTAAGASYSRRAEEHWTTRAPRKSR
jgi:hypothetical protein